MRNVAFAAILLLCLGCAKQHVPLASLVPEQTVLTRSEKAGGALVWVKPDFDPVRYDQLLIDFIDLNIPAKTIQDSGIPLAEYQALVTHFDAELRQAMAERYKVVELPGPRAVRLHAAITEVVPSSPVMYSLTLLNPFGLAMSYGSKALTGDHTFVGGAAIEMVFRDSMTGELIAVVKDRKSGDKFDASALTKLGQTRDILRDWAVMLREQADLQRGLAP